MGWMEGVLMLGVLVTVVARIPEPAIIDSTHREEKDTLLSYFTNVDANANTVTSCDLTVTKIKNVCQLRLEMPLMTLAEPDSEGACVDQYLQVTGGQGGNSIKICGDNAGQHPPMGCDQYHQEPSGSVKSFNYVNKPSTATLDTTFGIQPGARHLQGSYTVCAKVETESCGLTWSPGPDDYSFTITGNPTQAPEFNIQVNEDCLNPATDYLLFSIGEATDSDEPIILVCGTKFPPDVSSSSDRFKVEVNTVEAADNDLDNRGFHLNYIQKAC
ncbi:hypothetical protein Pmani_017481 [Petrolisthes manimaculis]|uniref:CUB domain-containing protein n=1 Tax=Petrolisthes manimaculis TaxID=1843537 RepID=A0AAE1PQ12_9EUCA|nr:hypothetical protein Pmani_017481 [Petrolisthes manimaculis]